MTIHAQRALEALRNGVPNSDAVNALGCMQPEALDRYRAQLDVLAHGAEVPIVPGSLIAGGFGTGKSHTLAFFEQEALRRNFVVSRVVISKETPLHDLSKVFTAAVREARLPGSRGSLLHELAIRVDYRKPPATAFVEWTNRGQPYGMVGASVCIHERSHTAELLEEVINWWSGEKLGVAPIRSGLKELGVPKAFEVKSVKRADLAPIRFEFAARLARAVGFAGWVILLDEVELIARYSLLQRAKSYAELARWLGAVTGQGIPGVTAVAAITDDFDIEVLTGRKDQENAPAVLQKKGDSSGLAMAAMATAGIRMIATEPIRLQLPSDDSLGVSFERVKDLYQAAYGGVIDGRVEIGAGTHRSMRSYVRRWISEWDLQRLYPGRQHESQEVELPDNKGEDPDLQQEIAE